MNPQDATFNFFEKSSDLEEPKKLLPKVVTKETPLWCTHMRGDEQFVEVISYAPDHFQL
jgi:hypothetical protein